MRNIIIFMIVTTVIFNLLGKSSYKKYVGIVTGLILVLLVVSPLLKFFKKDTLFDFSLEKQQSLMDAEDFGNKIFEMEESRNMDIMEEYKEVIAGQINRLLNEKGLYLLSLDAKVETDTQSIEFGTIYEISGTASYKKIKDGKISSIEPIKIGVIDLSKKEKKQQNGLSPMEISVKNMLADFYNLKPDNINITIQEDHDGE